MTFEEKVRNFFKKHKPGLAYLAPKIAKAFYHDQSTVLEHLHNRYVKGAPSTYDPNKVVKPKTAESTIGLGKHDDVGEEAVADSAEEISETDMGKLDGVAEEETEASEGTVNLEKADDAEEAPAEVEATEEEDKN